MATSLYFQEPSWVACDPKPVPAPSPAHPLPVDAPPAASPGMPKSEVSKGHKLLVSKQ